MSAVTAPQVVHRARARLAIAKAGAQVSAGSLLVYGIVPSDWAIEGGLGPGELHVTLNYLGRDGTPDEAKRVAAAIAHIAERTAPIEVTGSGVGTLGSDGAVVCHVNGHGLTRLYSQLVAALTPIVGEERANGTFDGYTPHVTLTYAPVGELDLEALTKLYTGRGFVLDTVAVRLGGEVVGTARLAAPVLQPARAAVIERKLAVTR